MQNCISQDRGNLHLETFFIITMYYRKNFSWKRDSQFKNEITINKISLKRELDLLGLHLPHFIKP